MIIRPYYLGAHKGRPYETPTIQPPTIQQFNISTIRSPMEILLEGTRPMLAIACVCALFVLLAMMIDLASGVHKAKQAGRLCTSYGLSRSVGKFMVYEGGVIIAAMIDLMIHYSHLLVLMRLHPIVGFPVVTCLMSIFLCVIEFMSIRERAEDKERKNMNRAIHTLVEAIGKDNLRAILRDKVDSTINDPTNN